MSGCESGEYRAYTLPTGGLRARERGSKIWTNLGMAYVYSDVDLL